MIQVVLGNTLEAQGFGAPEERGRTTLAQALEAYQNALQVYTRQQFP